MKSFRLSLLLAAVLILCLAGCGSGSSGASVSDDPPVTLIYAEVNPENTIAGQVAAAFKEKVEELSGGSVTVDVRYSGVLGSESDVLDNMLAGGDIISVARISASALNSYGAEKSVLLSLPYTFVSREHFWTFAQSELAQEIMNEAEDKLPVRGLFYGEEGFRSFFTTDPVSSYQDLAGRKLRVSNDPIMTGMTEALGAYSTVVSFSELYSALQTGVVDGAEQPIGNYLSNAFPEVAPNLLLDEHTLGIIEIIITDSAWDSLTPAQQEAVTQASAYAQEVNRRISQETEDEALAQLKEEGVAITEVSAEDKEAMQAACSELVSRYAKDELADVYRQIQEMK